MLPMQPVTAARLNAVLAPVWALLRMWTANAVAEHGACRDHLTREELVPIRRAIALIEAMLRRLVLVAASAIALDIAARNTAAHTTSTRRRSHTSSRTPTPSTRRARKTYRVYTHARAKSARRHTRAASTTRGRTSYSKTEPEISVEAFNAWCDAQPPITAAEYAATLRRQEEEVLRELEQEPKARRKPSTGERKPKLERKTVPELVSTQAERERLAMLQHLIDNPEDLIRRTAIALARHHELARRLADAEPPKARGVLIAAPEFYGTVIPFDAVCRKALDHCALNLPQPDTC